MMREQGRGGDPDDRNPMLGQPTRGRCAEQESQPHVAREIDHRDRRRARRVDADRRIHMHRIAVEIAREIDEQHDDRGQDAAYPCATPPPSCRRRPGMLRSVHRTILTLAKIGGDTLLCRPLR